MKRGSHAPRPCVSSFYAMKLLRGLIGKTNIFENIHVDESLLKYFSHTHGRHNKFKSRSKQNTRWGDNKRLN